MFQVVSFMQGYANDEEIPCESAPEVRESVADLIHQYRSEGYLLVNLARHYFTRKPSKTVAVLESDAGIVCITVRRI
jgi:hypothetical protein